MELEQLRDDLARELKRATGAKYLEAKNVLVDTVLPLMESIVEWVSEELDAVSEDLDELLDGNVETGVDEDLTLSVLALLGLASEIVSRLEHPNMEEDLKNLVNTFKNAVGPTMDQVKTLLEPVEDIEETEEVTEVEDSLDD